MALTNFVKSIRNIMRNDAGINGDAQRIEQIAWMLFLKVYDEKENDWEFNEDDYTSFIPENCRWRNWAKDDGTGEALTADKLLDFVNNTLFPTLKELEVTPQTPMRSAIVRATFQDANQYMKDGVLLRQVINVIDGLDLSSYEESHAFGEIYEAILKEMQSAGSAGEFYTPRALTDFMAEIINPQVGEKVADFACGTGGFLTSWLKALDKKVQTAEDREAFANSIYGIEKKQFPYMLCVTNMLLHDIDSPMVYHGNSLTKDVLNYTDDDKFNVILMNPPYGGNEKNDVKRHFPSDLASSETADLFMVVIQYRLAENGRAAEAASSHPIPASLPTSCSSTTRRQRVLPRDSAPRTPGSIASICLRALSTSRRPSPCSGNIASPSQTGGTTVRRSSTARRAMRSHVVSQPKSCWTLA